MWIAANKCLPAAADRRRVSQAMPLWGQVGSFILLWRVSSVLHRPYRHGHNVVHLHRLFHHERLAVADPDLVAVKARDRSEAVPDLLLLGKEASPLRGRAVLRGVAQKRRHAPLELRADIHNER